MPSFKSCLASLAIMAMAFQPIAAAANNKGGNNVARDVRAAAKAAALAKRANRVHEKRLGVARVLPAKAPTTPSGPSMPAGPTSANPAVDPYAANSPFLNTKAAVAARATRCNAASGNAVCTKATNPPANAVALCMAGSCTFRCKDGYAPSGTECVPSQTICGTTTCAAVTGGYTTCVGNQCNPGCYNGFTLFQAGTRYACFDLRSDADNCAAAGFVCPASYNGIGERRCIAGRCTISCPAGTYVRPASSASNPLTCN